MNSSPKKRGRKKITLDNYIGPSLPFEILHGKREECIAPIMVGGFKFRHKDRERFICSQPGCSSVASALMKDGVVFKVFKVTKHDHSRIKERIENKMEDLKLNEDT